MVINVLGECFRHLSWCYRVCWEALEDVLSLGWEGPALCRSGFTVVFVEPWGGLYFSWSCKGLIYILQVST